ncbi:MAG: EVE domain-containing protein [Gammaproteobacteria bacterium]|nr:MAG: EVE domain-containing protein [Gammaproteobacteria bacterium]
MQYWLVKSEPDAFGIDDLANMPDQTEHWDGVRNYQARNFMRDEMKCGDQVFFYHSNCKEPGIVGIVEVVREGYPDHTAFDPEGKYYDPKSDPDRPRWYMVDVKLVQRFRQTISLSSMKTRPELEGMRLLQKGNRLSVMPIAPEHWQVILDLYRENIG